MLAGYGITEWTPPLGTELAGYGYYLGRKAEWVDDPLFVRAAAFSDGENTYLLLCCDCLGISQPIAEQVKDALESRRGIFRENIQLVSIHTHTGPAIQYHFGCGEVNPEYTAAVPDRILRAAEAALDDLSPVSSLSFTKNPLAAPVALNRACAENPVDRDARFFRLERTGKKPLVLASYACHPVCRGISKGISADYPGAVCRALAAQGCGAMYLNGLCGDINPIRDLTDTDALIARFADTVLAAMKAGETPLPLTVSGGAVRDYLRMQPLTREEISAIADAVNRTETDPPGGGRVARAWEKDMLSRAFPLPTEEEITCHYLLLGGVPIVSLPFEGFTLTGMLIRNAIGDSRALVLGCQEEMKGYLPTVDDYDRHSYAARDAFFLYRRSPTVRGEAERIGESVGRKLAEKLKEGVSHD